MTRAEGGAGFSPERASTDVGEPTELEMVENGSTPPMQGGTTARRPARVGTEARGPIILLVVSVAIELAWLAALAYLVFRLL